MKKQQTIVAPSNINITIVGDPEFGEINLWWGNGAYNLFFDDDERMWMFDIDETFLLRPEDMEIGFKTTEEAIETLKEIIATNINDTFIDT